MCPTLCDPMDCSPPVSSIHGVFQTRVLEWVTIAKSCSNLCDPMDCSIPGFLSSTISWRLLRLTSIELAMLSNHILCCPVLLFLQSFSASGSFPMSQLFAPGGQILELKLQHQSFQWIFSLFPLGLTSLVSLQSKGYVYIYWLVYTEKFLYSVSWEDLLLLLSRISHVRLCMNP